MPKYIISEIDKEINKGKLIPLDRAIEKIENYIVKEIDKDFPTKAFRKWLNSEDEGPFRHKKNRYYWSK